MSFPESPVEAVTHPNTAAYYRKLAQTCPFYRDAESGMLVVSSADQVKAVLAQSGLGVRPRDERIPAAIAGTLAGEIFGNLVRMTDGPAHEPLKTAVSSALSALDPAAIAACCRRSARVLRPSNTGELERFLSDLPVYAVGSLLGIPEAQLPETARLMSDFARCFSPLSASDQIAAGVAAAEPLLAIVRTASDGPLLTALAEAMRKAGCDDGIAIPANAIGLIFQSYEATAGLIGNAVLPLTERDLPIYGEESIQTLLLETLRDNSSVQNTRRFAHASCSIAGHDLEPGDRVLILLAAANIDAGVPDFSFGFGAHACPGRELALAIAGAGVATLIDAGFAFAHLRFSGRYRPSINTRIPVFAGSKGASR
jgi:cytochrome P450